MQFIDFKAKLNHKAIFSTSDIRKLGEKFSNARLSDWQKAGYIIKLRRGWYVFSDKEKGMSELDLCYISNQIYEPSYVSLEFALSYYSLIPEGVFTITCVSTRTTKFFDTPIGRYNYRHILPRLNFGYNLVDWKGVQIKMASIEKTVLDYLYFTPDISTEEGFYEWRFNREEFLEKADLNKLQEYAKFYKKKRFLDRFEKLLKWIKEGTNIKVKI